MGFSRQEYWSGLPFPSPGDLPNPGIEPRSLALQADALTSEPPGKPRDIKRILIIGGVEQCCLQGGRVLVVGVSKWLKNRLVRGNRPDVP